MATKSMTSNISPSDLEDQENELVVLESILDKEAFLYNRLSDSLPSGQIQVDVELPKDFSICLKKRGVSTSTEEEIDANPETRLAEITYLPPITLLFTLPINYPSSEPPLFTLQSSWLDRLTLSLLCNSLDALWAKNEGTVILFSWITFLRQETLKLIGCDKLFEITLHPRRARHNGSLRETDESSPSTECMKPRPPRLKPNRHLDTPLDQRAVFTNSPMRDKEVLFNFLIEYNQERDEIEFRKGYHTCDVCFTDKSGEDFVRLGCGHFFCKICMLCCYETHIREGGIDLVKCLAVKCAGSPTSRQVHDIVGKDLFERYDKLLLQRALEGMTDLIYCPRVQCGKPVIMEPNEKLAWCFHCLYRFCAICKMVYHGVEPCRFKSDERQKLYDEYTKASKEERTLMEKTYGKKQLSLMVESTLSEKYIEKESKPCPHCKIPIEKFEGCNKVTCTKCGAYFCWMCSKHLDKTNPYHHFQDPTSPCYNLLFENVDEDDDDDEFDDFSDDDEDFHEFFRN